MALNRAIALPESPEKQVRIQAFASIINTMIETCPPIQNAAAANAAQQSAGGFRQSAPPSHTLNPVNNIMKIMHKKGLINELARVPLYMDLSSSKCIDSINTILKPLETMTKMLNISTRKPFAPAALGAKRLPAPTGTAIDTAAVATTATASEANQGTSTAAANQAASTTHETTSDQTRSTSSSEATAVPSAIQAAQSGDLTGYILTF